MSNLKQADIDAYESIKQNDIRPPFEPNLDHATTSNTVLPSSSNTKRGRIEPESPSNDSTPTHIEYTAAGEKYKNKKKTAKPPLKRWKKGVEESDSTSISVFWNVIVMMREPTMLMLIIPSSSCIQQPGVTKSNARHIVTSDTTGCKCWRIGLSFPFKWSFADADIASSFFLFCSHISSSDTNTIPGDKWPKKCDMQIWCYSWEIKHSSSSFKRFFFVDDSAHHTVVTQRRENYVGDPEKPTPNQINLHKVREWQLMEFSQPEELWMRQTNRPKEFTEFSVWSQLFIGDPR
ncbi:hypothetical protein JTB14_021156 [Gonioctena quinquepunctata]|nr:hypothetical protein JTB14_021156 [Gonioctena quinquepunctata]